MSLPVLEFPDSVSFRTSKMADESHCTGSALRFCEQMSQVASTTGITGKIKLFPEQIYLCHLLGFMITNWLDNRSQWTYFPNG